MLFTLCCLIVNAPRTYFYIRFVVQPTTSIMHKKAYCIYMYGNTYSVQQLQLCVCISSICPIVRIPFMLILPPTLPPPHEFMSHTPHVLFPTTRKYRNYWPLKSPVLCVPTRPRAFLTFCLLTLSSHLSSVPCT
jgi:hypothetical protein